MKKISPSNVEDIRFYMHKDRPIGDVYIINKKNNFYLTWDKTPKYIQVYDELLREKIFITWLKIHRYTPIERDVYSRSTIYEKEDN